MKNVRITVVAPRGVGYANLEEKWSRTGELLEIAAAARPDLVVLPECMNVYDMALMEDADRLQSAAAVAPGPQTEMFQQWAAENESWVVLPLIEVLGWNVVNAAVVIDRSGEVAGRYVKTHPTIAEMEAGIVPGDGPAVVETDFGPIGIAICYDANFPALFAAYAELDVRLLCFCSMFAGGRLLSARALEHGYPVVSAYEEESRFIDAAGRTVSAGGYRMEVVAGGGMPPVFSRTVDLDTAQVHLDTIGPHLESLLRERAGEVQFDILQDEGFVLLRTPAEGLSTRAVMEELGLEERKAYLRRAMKVQRGG